MLFRSRRCALRRTSPTAYATPSRSSAQRTSSWVFGVEACERSERSFAACDAVGKVYFQELYTPDSPLDHHTFSVAFYSIDGSTADTLYNSNVVNRSIVSPVKENNISCHRGITSVPEPALTFKLSDTVRTKGKFRNDSTTFISHLIFSNYRVFW